MNTATNKIHAHGLAVAEEGGSAKRIGNKVEVTFAPQVKPSDITDRVPDSHLNPNSIQGACELSAREIKTLINLLRRINNHESQLRRHRRSYL